jgi:FkbM family methyltransferase
MRLTARLIKITYNLVPDSISEPLKRRFYIAPGGVDFEELIYELYADENLPSTKLDVLDIGARQAGFKNAEPPKKKELGNLHDTIRPLHKIDKLNLTGIEPDGQECKRLDEVFSDYDYRFLPSAVWNQADEKTLYITKHRGWTSLLEPNMDLLNRFNVGEDPQIVNKKKITTDTINNILSSEISFDIIKIDVQGAEYQVMEGANEMLDNCLLIESEVSFLPFYKNMELYSEYDKYLSKFGFRMLDMNINQYLRTNDIESGYTSAQKIGEGIHNDAIFFNYGMSEDLSEKQLFKSVIGLLLYKKISLAKDIIEINRDNISEEEYNSYIQIINKHWSKITSDNRYIEIKI